MAGHSFQVPSWSGFNFVPTLHNKVPEALNPANQPLPEELVVCITGASRGIGADIAKSFAKAGVAGLILTARTKDALKDTIEACMSNNKSLKISPMAVNVSSESEVQALASLIQNDYGKLDVLINNAGVVSTDPSAFLKLEDMNLSQIQDIMNINYTGRFLTIKYLLPLLKASTSAKTIIDISSIGAHFTGGGPLGFNISALASNRLIECVADTYGAEGILCYSVHPGMVGNPTPPPGMPARVNVKCTDSPDLCAAFLLWLLRERPAWLNGRYLSATWDVEDLKKMQEEIVMNDKLKMRMVV